MLQDVCCLYVIVFIYVFIFVLEIGQYFVLIFVLNVFGICVQFGYSVGSYVDGVVVLEVGVVGFIYLFNGMIGVDYYQFGIVIVVLVYVQYVELIFDLQYVYFGVICIVLCVILCLYCVIDVMVVIGMFDGEYVLGVQCVYKCLGCV